MFRKPELHKKVVELRRKGFSYHEIFQIVKVGYGTISRWCQEVQLTEGQKMRLYEKKRNNSWILEMKRRRVRSTEEANIWIEKNVKNFKYSKELLLTTGALLYWAEGGKLNEARGNYQVEFTNTDSRMIQIMMRFFRETMDVPENKFKIMPRIGSKGNAKEAKKYWMELTGVSQDRVYKTEILQLTEKSKSLMKYPHGICRIVIHDILIARKIDGLIHKFAEFMLP